MNPIDDSTRLGFPSSRARFRFSRAAVGLILGALLLAVILALTTIQDIRRAREQMGDFLFQQGMLIIRSIETGTRTAMRHQMFGADPLAALVAENSREEGVAFIRIINQQGQVLATAGEVPATIAPDLYQQVMAQGLPLVALDDQTGLFIISKEFQPSGPPFGMMRGMNRNRQRHQNDSLQVGTQVITVGLQTGEFDAARRRDVRHSLLMGAILFLVGSAGLYFLFLYQGMRVARTTLANMRLYTGSVIESIPAGLVTLDANERIVSCNRRVTEMLGVRSEDVVGASIRLAFPACPMDGTFLEDGGQERFIDCTTASGQTMPLAVNSSPLVDQDGKVIGTVLILRDMSQIRDMEQQLERSRRMAALGKMAAGIAHEIRNPLGTLRGFAQYFGAQAGTDSEGQRYAELMVSEVDRLNQNISGLLQFARPRDPSFDLVDLDRLLDRAITMMAADVKSHGLTLSIPPPSGILLTADADQLLQVLLNLIKNAIAASVAGGRLSLAAERRGSEVVIRVQDQGRGMDSEERERMFDPFFTTRREGTGLGLAVSHQIVEQHGGRFEVESSPGQGTTIAIVLPGGES